MVIILYLLPKNASSLKFSRHNAHVISLCLTLHVNLGLSLRKTSQALKDLYKINILNAATRSVIGYQVSDNRGVGPCILAMRMAFRGLAKLPENFKFIADGYSAYPLAAMEFAKKLGEGFVFKITQVIGLTNDDAVSSEHRPFKQMIERLNRTYKASYRHTNGFDNINGADNMPGKWQLLIFLGQQTILNLQKNGGLASERGCCQ